jgi:WD40 repeat protein
MDCDGSLRDVAEFSFTYRAFISYAHADRQWAVWLHRALERYRVPRRIAGAQGLRRLGKIFRDEEELAAAAELGPKIEEALKASDVLLVVCSPRSARSKWVNQEIEAFKRLGREHRVFALIVDGEPHDAAQECFPWALKQRTDGKPAEPLAVDVRKFGREDTVLRLVAGMLDVGYDDLRQREIRRRRIEQRRAQTLFALGLVLIAAALTGGYFAATNYVDASERTSRLFAREANTLFEEGQYAKAMLMALYGDPSAEAGIAEQFLRPSGFVAAREALVRGQTHNTLQKIFDGPSSVSSVAYSPDGKFVLTASLDGPARLWSVSGGEALATFAGPRSGGFSPDGKIVLTSSSVAFSPDGKLVLTSWGDGTMKLWPVEGGEARVTFHDDGNGMYQAVFSPDGRFIATRSNKDVKVWPAEGGEGVVIYRSPVSMLTSIAFSPDGKSVLVGNSNGMATILPLTGGDARATFSHENNASITSVSYSPDGSFILTASADGTARVWPPTSGSSLYILEHDTPVSSAAFSPDGRFVLTGRFDGRAILWDFEQQQQVATFAGHTGSIDVVAFSPDGSLFLTGSDDHTARLWLAGEEKPLATGGQRGAGNAVAVSADGKSVVTGSYEGIVSLWAMGGGTALKSFEGHREPVNEVAFSSDGQFVITGSEDTTAKLWSAQGGAALATFIGHTAPVKSVAISANSKLVLTGSGDGYAKVWPSNSGRALATFGAQGGRIMAVGFSPDGTSIATGADDGVVKVWPTSGGEPLAVLAEHEGEIMAVAISPDGRWILTGSADQTAKLWSAEGGPSQVTFGGHPFGLSAVAFSADGNFVLTGSESVRLWSSKGGPALATFDGGEDFVSSVGFSADGRTVQAGYRDGTARSWAIPEIVLAEAKEQVRSACTTLKEIGVMEFSDVEYARFPILNREEPHPCTNFWGFDPRVR